MTGGCVTVLGETGLNFGAGMTGGMAFVLDETRASPIDTITNSSKYIALVVRPQKHIDISCEITLRNLSQRPDLHGASISSTISPIMLGSFG